MFFVISFVICLGFLSYTLSSAKQCDPANHICSGRCPNVPPNIELSDGIAVCMKDSSSRACVCWLKSNTSHANSLFLCEAFINGSSAQVLCQAPAQCFPPDSVPTCLVIPFCDCSLINDGLSALEYGNWKPVKAVIQINWNPEKYPDHIREFSLKHLLFLLGFVIAPLLCWCFLNFINENKCRRKREHCPETQPINADRRNIDHTLSSDTAENEAPHAFSVNSNMNVNGQPSAPSQPSVCVTDDTASVRLSIHCPHHVTGSSEKNENPPSYDEAVLYNQLQDDENSPPPSYDESIRGQDSTLRQGMM